MCTNRSLCPLPLHISIVALCHRHRIHARVKSRMEQRIQTRFHPHNDMYVSSTVSPTLVAHRLVRPSRDSYIGWVVESWSLARDRWTSVAATAAVSSSPFRFSRSILSWNNWQLFDSMSIMYAVITLPFSMTCIRCVVHTSSMHTTDGESSWNVKWNNRCF